MFSGQLLRLHGPSRHDLRFPFISLRRVGSRKWSILVRGFRILTFSIDLLFNTPVDIKKFVKKKKTRKVRETHLNSSLRGNVYYYSYGFKNANKWTNQQNFKYTDWCPCGPWPLRRCSFAFLSEMSLEMAERNTLQRSPMVITPQGPKGVGKHHVWNRALKSQGKTSEGFTGKRLLH